MLVYEGNGIFVLLSPFTRRSFMLKKLLPKKLVEFFNLLSLYKHGNGINSHYLRKKSPRSLLAKQIFSNYSRIKSRSTSLMHLLKALSTYIASLSGHFTYAFMAAALAGYYLNNYLNCEVCSI